jgi:hypothetical protein
MPLAVQPARDRLGVFVCVYSGEQAGGVGGCMVLFSGGVVEWGRWRLWRDAKASGSSCGAGSATRASAPVGDPGALTCGTSHREGGQKSSPFSATGAHERSPLALSSPPRTRPLRTHWSGRPRSSQVLPSCARLMKRPSPGAKPPRTQSSPSHPSRPPAHHTWPPPRPSVPSTPPTSPPSPSNPNPLTPLPLPLDSTPSGPHWRDREGWGRRAPLTREHP